MRVIAIALLLFSASVAAAQDWTQFRGPSRDGIVPTAVIPAARRRHPHTGPAENPM